MEEEELEEEGTGLRVEGEEGLGFGMPVSDCSMAENKENESVRKKTPGFNHNHSAVREYLKTGTV